MRILVVHEVSYRNKPVYEYQDFAERLSSLGHEVTVVDFEEENISRPIEEKISRTGTSEIILKTIQRPNFPILKYWLARQNYKVWLEGQFRARHFDVVLLYSVFINGTNTVRLCKKFGIPVVFRILDIYHILRSNPLLSLPLYWGEKFIYKNADVICLTNEKLIPYLEKMCRPQKPKRSTVLHHGVDTKHFRKLPRDKTLAAQLKISTDDCVALFLGTTYRFAGLDCFISHLKEWAIKMPKLKLCIVGAGEKDQALRRQVAALKLENRVVFSPGMIGYQELPQWLSLADIALNTFELNDITRDIVPIKNLQYLASGIPILSTPLPDVVRLLPEHFSGSFYVDIHHDLDKFHQQLSLLYFDSHMRKKSGEMARDFIEKKFSIDTQIKTLEVMLERAREPQK